MRTIKSKDDIRTNINLSKNKDVTYISHDEDGDAGENEDTNSSVRTSL